MARFRLSTRLLLSHLLVMVVGLGTFTLIAKFSSPRFFVLRLEQLEQRGLVTVRSARTYLIDGFESAWNSSSLWSVIIGGTTAGGLSLWLSQRITQPLGTMATITQKFASGQLQERMPTTEIPELNELAQSFNRMANSLEGVEKRRRELIGDLTHELRTPLTVMRGYLEELSDGGLEPSPELYLRLVRETKRLERLTHDLQELSKAEAGYLPIQLQRVELLPLLRGMVERFQDQLIDDNPRLRLDCPTDLPMVWADFDRTEQVVMNLVGNALRYTEAGEITLKAWGADKCVWVAVIDTGVGIAEADLPYVFERFWRADRSRSLHSGGTGIGLAITRRLVELQNGQIEVESELDRGSTFKFCLPVA
ncbi:HAMP domain-containing sensor histidine kinase [Spirulina major CS-329]|uniref:sensor histidine kinase n=1 Tax=Spirulina TaxID=1154 RepID=UPI00232C0DB0|nr:MULTISPECIES: HAMP domain-containing sensor histidine kinase [Spirulina]MDB9495130.1 HAMP domain-containing sensor histidine kinase [Spirulina subsalsa CS-330]MDB9503621.1 HAMP domain-containing sensor histidine kinase [Spirulina major CS-329]